VRDVFVAAFEVMDGSCGAFTTALAQIIVLLENCGSFPEPFRTVEIYAIILEEPVTSGSSKFFSPLLPQVIPSCLRQFVKFTYDAWVGYAGMRQCASRSTPTVEALLEVRASAQFV